MDPAESLRDDVIKEVNMDRTRKIALIALCHIIFIAASNIFVQYPFKIWGYHSTFGAVIYPFIFIVTDLTTRFLGAPTARKVVLCSMLPGLLLSYMISSFIAGDLSFGLDTLYIVPFRIAMASLLAYTSGQIFDIHFFQAVNKRYTWWVAPLVVTPLGNLMDTFIFFAAAFYHSTLPFMNTHWVEIAIVDVIFKVGISVIFFVPMYGVIYKFLVRKG
jgi:queuosine precursor transporter